MRPPGLIFQVADDIYDNAYIKGLALDKDLRGFTLLYYIRIDQYDVLDILFGYVKDSYVFYVFDSNWRGDAAFKSEIIVQNLNGLHVLLNTLAGDFNLSNTTKHIHRIIANLPYNKYKYCTLTRCSSLKPQNRVLFSTQSVPLNVPRIESSYLYIDCSPALFYGLGQRFNNKVCFDPGTFANELDDIREWHQDNELEMLTPSDCNIDEMVVISSSRTKFGNRVSSRHMELLGGEEFIWYYVIYPN